MVDGKLKEAVEQFNKKSVLVIGDIMLDQYTFGNVTRVSPEAPILILKKIGAKFVPGGAGNVAANLASLGASVTLCGVVGDDPNRKALFTNLEEIGVSTKLILVEKDRETTLKHRFVSGNHQLLRVDSEQETNLDSSDEKTLLQNLEKEISDYHAVILSDYAKGLFSRSLATSIIALCHSKKIPVFADIKPKNKAFFKGVDLITPNLKEGQEMSGETDIEKIGKKLIAFFRSDVILTRGEGGMTVFHKNGSVKTFVTRKIKVFDVSGAGDTVIAVVVLGTISGLSLDAVTSLANYAAGIVVQRPGTTTITSEELASALLEDNHIEAVEIVPKVWGYERWLENNDKFCSKLLSLRKRYQCSLHYHKVKDEMFLVTKGHVRFELDKEVLHMRAGNFVRVMPGIPHRFRGIEDSEILEVSTHHSEEDSYRLEKSRKV